MKISAICILMLFVSLICKAQTFVIINDPDGFVNFREAAHIKSTVIARIPNGQLLITSGDDNKPGNWQAVYIPSSIIDYTGNTHPENKKEFVEGYVHADRLISIDKLPHISVSNKNRQLNTNRLTIKNDSIELTVSTRPFRTANHKIIWDKSKIVYQIDRTHPYGTDGELPHVEISAMQLTINQQNITIPAKAYYDLYEPNLKNINMYFDRKGNCYLHMLASDGAGYYDVVWIFSNGKLISRYLDNSNA